MKNFSPGKIYRSKVFIGAVCIIIACVIGIFTIPRYNSDIHNKVKVWQATQTIYEYQTITKDMVKAVDVGTNEISKDVIKSNENIIGKTAKEKIVKGTNITTEQLLNDTRKEILSELSSKGKCAATVTLPNLAASVGGQIKSGDVVSVITFKKVTASSSTSSSNSFSNGIVGNITSATDMNDKEAVSYPLLKYLQVVSITNKNGTPIDGTGSQNSDSSTNIPSTVTFACNQQQANLLAEIEKKNDIYIVFIARGEQAEEILKQQSTISNSDGIDNNK